MLRRMADEGKARAWLGAVLALCVGWMSVASAEGEAEPDPWTPTLVGAGHDPRAGLEPGRWRDGGRLTLEPRFTRLWDDWRQVAPHAEGLGRAVAAAAERGDLAMVVSRTGAPLAEVAALGTASQGVRGPSHDLTTNVSRVLLHYAIIQLHASRGLPLDLRGRAELAAWVQQVPRRLAEVAAPIVAALPAVLDAADRGLRPWLEATRQATRLSVHAVDAPMAERLAATDLAAFVEGAGLLADAFDGSRRARDRLAQAAPVGSFALVWETPAGKIALHGDGDDVHRESCLLLIDAGGNDRHLKGGATRADLPVSVAIDLAGDDAWGTPLGDGEVAAGVAGIGAAFDLAGNDRWTSRNLGLGAAALGAGLLVDVAGDDVYRSHEHAQGAATAGLGLLVDLAGDDRYFVVQRGQAFAQVRGVGALVDVRGDDRYVADDETIVNPAPQTALHNTSLAQGCGFGRRAHPGDGLSLGGGLGLLVDARGDDEYRCGVFGQGTGYWYAIGALVDLEGDDLIHGAYYAQGAAAHYAVGVLIDGAGDDHHRVTMGQGLALGQDQSVGVVVDRAGNDVHEVPANGVGSAILNGVGAFLDLGGDDRYVCGSFGTLGDPGHHSGSRPNFAALGIFVDEGGQDAFPADHPLARPGTTWKTPPATDQARALGAGRHGHAP